MTDRGKGELMSRELEAVAKKKTEILERAAKSHFIPRRMFTKEAATMSTKRLTQGFFSMSKNDFLNGCLRSV